MLSWDMTRIRKCLTTLKMPIKTPQKTSRLIFIIPSGQLFQRLIASGVEKIHRDTFHASYGLGRYALGLLWYAKLTGNKAGSNTFSDFDEEISCVNIEIAKKCVEEICNT